jgi:hypothetical protein
MQQTFVQSMHTAFLTPRNVRQNFLRMKRPGREAGREIASAAARKVDNIASLVGKEVSR